MSLYCVFFLLSLLQVGLCQYHGSVSSVFVLYVLLTVSAISRVPSV